jgi:drug/metabolite transporter (DMT)-like permease
MTGNTERSGYLLAAITVCLWAGFVLVSRMGGTGDLSPFDITALRFGTAALVLAPVWVFFLRVPLFTLRMLVLAMVGGIAYAVSVYAGFRLAPAAHGALLVSGLLPFGVAFFVWLLLGEAPKKSLQAGLVLISLGVLCLAADIARHGVTNTGLSAGSVLLGDGLLVAASLCWALYTVLIRRWQFAPWETTVGVALLASLIYLPAYFLLWPDNLVYANRDEVLLQSFYQGIIVVIVAMVLYMQAMQRLGPARLGAMMALVPALAGVGVSLLLGEALTAWLLCGLLLTSAGAWLGVRGGIRAP